MRHLPWCNDWSLFFILALCRDRVPTQANPQNLIQQHQSLLSPCELSGCPQNWLRQLRAAADGPQWGECGWVVSKETWPGGQHRLLSEPLPSRDPSTGSKATDTGHCSHESGGGIPEQQKKRSSFILFCFGLLISFLKFNIWVKSKCLSFSDLFRLA